MSSLESVEAPSLASATSDLLDSLLEVIKNDTRLTLDAATRPHPMLLLLSREDASVGS
jgi:hypothetical protein